MNKLSNEANLNNDKDVKVQAEKLKEIVNREKVICWGLGREMQKINERLKEKYEIVAYTDSRITKDYQENNEYYITPSAIKDKEFDMIIITTRVGFEAIRYLLIFNHKVDASKIITLDTILSQLKETGDQLLAREKIYKSIDVYRQAHKLSDSKEKFSIDENKLLLFVNDFSESAGASWSGYFAQDIWAARKIHHEMPKNHYDIGSLIIGFIAHLLTFLDKVNYIDIRPLPYKIDRLEFVQADATNLEFIPDNSIYSLSTLSVVEHFGLGRYGDPIDPDACFKAMKSFVRVLAQGGKLYFAVPIASKDELIFNAARIFHPMTIIEGFKGLDLLEFSIVEEGSYNSRVIKIEDIETTEFVGDATGLFEFIKR